ncbi:MAG TPA: helix-turn-helix domain-containing protein [Pirellulaceae bacterium]|nr:helix-turn-helix domain-containing protein [Pirellulaceae bacterium]
MIRATKTADVLTLEEAAAFLRVSPQAIEELADGRRLPARRVAGHWRFLKSALEDWLRSSTGQERMLSQVGALANDPYLQRVRAAIAKGRRRSAERK